MRYAQRPTAAIASKQTVSVRCMSLYCMPLLHRPSGRGLCMRGDSAICMSTIPGFAAACSRQRLQEIVYCSLGNTTNDNRPQSQLLSARRGP